MPSDAWQSLGYGFRARLAARALEDEEFRRELIANPRTTIQREYRRATKKVLRLPKDLHIEVHQESTQSLHLVIPERVVATEKPDDMLIFWERILRPDS